MKTIIKQIFFVALLYATTVTAASAAIIDSISGVVVDGTEYTAYFHPGKSYNDIWNGASSLLNRDPMFLNDRDSAQSAAFRIAYLMEDEDETEAGTDRMMVPFSLSNSIISGFVDTDPSSEDIWTVGGTYITSTEGAFNHPYVSFELANGGGVVVPVPAAIYLFASALVGFGFISKKRKSVTEI